MATATLEAPQVKPEKEPRPQWEMPPIHVGAKVFWFEHANRSRTPQPAIVESIAGGTISCRVMAGGLAPYKSCARHLDDPFLVKHPQAAAEADAGGWDYSTEYKEERARWAAIESRIAALEELVAPSKKSNKKSDES